MCTYRRFPVCDDFSTTNFAAIVGEQCGEFGTKTITVQWIPSEVNANAHETVTLTDGVSGTTCVVNLIANVTPGTQNLYWQDRPTVISNCGDIEFPEQTTAHIDIIWEVVSGQVKFNILIAAVG